jgi:hypothetical protein
MPTKKSSVTAATVKGRLLSKSLAQRLELVEEAIHSPGPVEESQNVDDVSPRRPEPEDIPPKGAAPRSVFIVEKPREAMINQGLRVFLSENDQRDDDTPEQSLTRMGVDRISGSLFHCILRAIYPPYMEWERERRVRKVKEFRQDLAANFDGYYLRLDQANVARPSLTTCKNDLEKFNGPLPYYYMEYLSKVINKVIVLITVTPGGVLSSIPGGRIYGKPTRGHVVNGNSDNGETKTSSPITYVKAEPVYIFILHLGGPAYELLTWRRKGSDYTLFPESHVISRRILQIATQQ